LARRMHLAESTVGLSTCANWRREARRRKPPLRHMGGDKISNGKAFAATLGLEETGWKSQFLPRNGETFDAL
jgi:hypothetical protein